MSHDLKGIVILLDGHEQHRSGDKPGQQVHLLLELGDLRDIAAGAVEALCFAVVIEKVEMDQKAHPAPVDLVEGQQCARAVEPVVIGPLQRIKEHRHLFLGHILLDIEEPVREIGGVDSLIKLLVEADDIDRVSMPGVNGRRADDVVEHGIGIDVVAQKFPDMEFLVELEGEALGVHVPCIRNERLILVHRHRLVVIIALDIPASETHQIGALLVGFNALHNDRHRHGLGHVDDGFDDVHALLFRHPVHAQEIGVELDHVNIQLAQHVERGKAAAEIVHQDGKAEITEFLHRGTHLVGVLAVGGLGDLNLDGVSGQIVFFDKLCKVFGHVHGENVHRADVQRDRDQGIAHVERVPGPFADLLPDVLVQIRDEAVALERGDEGDGRNARAVGLDPAGQRLCADDLPVYRAALRLQEEGDLAVDQRVLEGRQDLVVLSGLLHQGGGIEEHAGFVILLCLLAGQRCLIIKLIDRGAAVGVTGAERGEKADGDAVLADNALDCSIEGVGVKTLDRDEDDKVVPAHIAGNAVMGFGDVGELMPDIGKDMVAQLTAVPFVEELEMLQVNGDQDPVGARVGEDGLAEGIKILLARKTREQVAPHFGLIGGKVLSRLAVLAALNIIDVEINKLIRSVLA